MTVKEILTDLVAFNTIKDKQNKEIMDYIRQFLEKRGFDVECLANAETGKLILRANYGENPAIGFLGHTDTVDITDGWTTDPFTLIEKDGKVYGLGSCDMKGGLAAAMAAIDATDLASLKHGVSMICTYDEEIMFEGVKDVVAAGTKFPPHMVIAEPTDLIPMIGSKGLLEIIFTFKGITTHSSMPIDGKSSNKNAVRFLNKMMDVEEELRKRQTPFFEVPYPTMNIGTINGGTAINKVPDKTVVYMDFRICDSKVEYPIIRKAIDDALSQFDPEDVSYEIINDIPSFYTKSDLVGIYEEKTGNKGQAFFGITEASFFEGDRVIIGPGPMTGHQANEYVMAESLEKTTKLYAEMIEHLCR